VGVEGTMTNGRRLKESTASEETSELRIAQRFLEGCSQIFGVKPEWSGFAFIENTTVCDQIHSIRPSGVCGLNLIVEAIDESGKFNPQPLNAHTSYRGALLLIAGAAEQYLVLHIALHLPYVGGMSLKDVDGVEVNLAPVLLSQFIQGGNLPPKGRSSIATEDENNRLIGPNGCQPHGRFRIECLDGEIGCGIANL
jgi:hypothetical protein